MGTTFELEEAKVFEAIPEDTIVEAEIQTVEERETPFDIDKNDPSKGKQHQVSFRFNVTGPAEYAGRVLFGNTPVTFSNHPDCKLRVWVQEILGTDTLPLGFKLDLSQLEGAPVKVVVGNRVKQAADGTTVAKDFAQDVLRVTGFVDASDAF